MFNIEIHYALGRFSHINVQNIFIEIKLSKDLNSPTVYDVHFKKTLFARKFSSGLNNSQF